MRYIALLPKDHPEGDKVTRVWWSAMEYQCRWPYKAITITELDDIARLSRDQHILLYDLVERHSIMEQGSRTPVEIEDGWTIPEEHCGGGKNWSPPGTPLGKLYKKYINPHGRSVKIVAQTPSPCAGYAAYWNRYIGRTGQVYNPQDADRIMIWQGRVYPIRLDGESYLSETSFEQYYCPEEMLQFGDEWHCQCPAYDLLMKGCACFKSQSLINDD